MEIDGDSAGGSTNASWINPEDLGKCVDVIYTSRIPWYPENSDQHRNIWIILVDLSTLSN